MEWLFRFSLYSFKFDNVPDSSSMPLLQYLFLWFTCWLYEPVKMGMKKKIFYSQIYLISKSFKLKLTGMTESLEATIALKRLLAGVQALVLFEMMLVLKRFSAVLEPARIRPTLARVMRRTATAATAANTLTGWTGRVGRGRRLRVRVFNTRLGRLLLRRRLFAASRNGRGWSGRRRRGRLRWRRVQHGQGGGVRGGDGGRDRSWMAAYQVAAELIHCVLQRGQLMWLLLMLMWQWDRVYHVIIVVVGVVVRERVRVEDLHLTQACQLLLLLLLFDGNLWSITTVYRWIGGRRRGWVERRWRSG